MRLRLDEDFAILRSIVGAKLLGLARCQYLFNGQLSLERDDGDLEMRFDGNRVITFLLASNGDSVRAVAEAMNVPQPFELDSGNTCAWERVDLGVSPDCGHFIGRSVAVVEAVIDTWIHPPCAEVVSGWIIRFAGDASLAYQNMGDVSRILFDEVLIHPDPAIRTRTEAIG